MKKQIIYYCCNTHSQKIYDLCRSQLLESSLPIVSVSLNKKIDFGDIRIVVKGKKGAEMMHYQILTALEASSADIIFFCETDVLYPTEHFDFTPPTKDTFYYNTNVWKYHTDTHKYTWTDDLQQVSGIAVYREVALDFYRKRYQDIKENGFDGHFEPKSKATWQSTVPLICIRHNNTFTKTKKTPEEFRNKKYAKGWKEVDTLPGWGSLNI